MLLILLLFCTGAGEAEQVLFLLFPGIGAVRLSEGGAFIRAFWDWVAFQTLTATFLDQVLTGGIGTGLKATWNLALSAAEFLK